MGFITINFSTINQHGEYVWNFFGHPHQTVKKSKRKWSESQVEQSEIFPDSLGFFGGLDCPGIWDPSFGAGNQKKTTDPWICFWTSRIVCSWIFEAGCDADANGKVSVSECLGCLLEGSCLAWICLRFLGRRWFLSRCFVAIAYLSREHEITKFLGGMKIDAATFEHEISTSLVHCFGSQYNEMPLDIQISKKSPTGPTERTPKP